MPTLHDVKQEFEDIKNLTVLYVEDDEDVREQMAISLRRRVAKLLVANDGKQGLTLFRDHCPQLVITDILMPEMDGLSMAKEIRELNPHVPIIVATAFEQTDYLKRSIEIGIDKYVTKPVEMRLLYSAMSQCVRATRLSMLLRESEERYRTMFQNFNIGICILTPPFPISGNIVIGCNVSIIDCNSTFLKLFGYSCVEELINTPYVRLISKKFKPLISSVTIGHDSPRSIIVEQELEMLHKNGTPIPVLVQSILRHNQEGEPIELWELITDMTERKRSQQQIELAARVFEGSAEAIMITDSNNHIISVNQAFSKVTGYDKEDALGKNPSLLGSGIHPPKFYTEMWATIKSSGYWQGEIFNRRKNGELYPEWLSISVLSDPIGEISNYIGIFSDISNRKANEDKIKYLAQHDILTGLPNRMLLKELMAQACADNLRLGSYVGVLFLDLDNFKTINDSLGHSAGDELLQTVARRLVQGLRASDIVCRQGGDEFIIILNGIDCSASAEFMAKKILETLAAPVPLQDSEIHITSSIGISIYPVDGMDIDNVIKNADSAMYQAKQFGRNNYQFYSRKMSLQANKRSYLENGLRQSLEQGQLVLHYQPQVNLHTGNVVGYEALLRWNNPDLGLLLPAEFISIAEESGLIIGIGEWVLETACRYHQKWLVSCERPIRLAVNISSVQFRQKNFLDKIKLILENTGMKPQNLELEITESVLIKNYDQVTNTLLALKELGLSITLDDFGTGYSSLNYLRRFHFDTLKLDNSIVSAIADNQEDATIFKAILHMAKGLNLRVIGEGVETMEQIVILKKMGLEIGQGNFIGEALPHYQAQGYHSFIGYRNESP